MTRPWQTASGVWPIIETVVVAALRAAVPTVDGQPVTVTTETDLTLKDRLPLLRVHALGGGASDGFDDDAAVDVESFALTREQMWELAGLAHRAVLLLPQGGVVDDVTVTSTPGYIDYGTPEIRRALATYRLTTRAQTSV